MNADSRDYDDACIVFLDGEEVYRSPNIAAATGTPYAFDEETLSSNHEASAGSGGAGVSIRASDGGHIDLAGTGAQPVVMRSPGSGDWNELSATGAGGTLTIRHANISGGRVRFLSGATGLAEDSWFHDSGASSIIHASAATSATLRHVAPLPGFQLWRGLISDYIDDDRRVFVRGSHGGCSGL